MADLIWAIYWIDVLTALPSQLGWGVAFAVFGALVVLTIHGAYNSECVVATEVPAAKIIKRMWLAAAVILIPTLLIAFIPSKQTMYLMLGIKATDNIVNSETGQKVQTLLNEKLDEYLQELTTKKKEK